MEKDETSQALCQKASAQAEITSPPILMPLQETIQKDALVAAKAGKAVEADILKMVLASLKNARIANNNEDLGEEEEIKVVFAEAKKVKDSIEQYKKGGREDLMKREEEQLLVIERYLPAQADEDEIRNIVEKVIGDTGAANMGHMGMVMGAVMKELQGKADGSVVSAVVKDMLS